MRPSCLPLRSRALAAAGKAPANPPRRRGAGRCRRLRTDRRRARSFARWAPGRPCRCCAQGRLLELTGACGSSMAGRLSTRLANLSPLPEPPGPTDAVCRARAEFLAKVHLLAGYTRRETCPQEARLAKRKLPEEPAIRWGAAGPAPAKAPIPGIEATSAEPRSRGMRGFASQTGFGRRPPALRPWVRPLAVPAFRPERAQARCRAAARLGRRGGCAAKGCPRGPSSTAELATAMRAPLACPRAEHRRRHTSGLTE